MKTVYLIDMKTDVAKALFNENIIVDAIVSDHGIFIFDTARQDLADFLLTAVDVAELQAVSALASTKIKNDRNKDKRKGGQ